MERRLINLEMKGFKAELNRRNATLDILQADRMRYWLAGWEQSYAAAFDTDNYRGPDLRPGQCLERIRDVEAYIADRLANNDRGKAKRYQPWFEAMKATFRQAGGKGLPDDSEPEQATEQPQLPMSPDQLAQVPWPSLRSTAGKIMGRQFQPATSKEEVERAYADWYRKEYARLIGSEPVAA